MQQTFEYTLTSDELQGLSAATGAPAQRMQQMHYLTAMVAAFAAGLSFGADFMWNGFVMLAGALTQWSLATGSMSRLVGWMFPASIAPWKCTVSFHEDEIQVQASNAKRPASRMLVKIPWDRVRAIGSVTEYHDCFVVAYPTRNGRTPIRSLHFPKRVLDGRLEIQELRSLLANAFQGPIIDQTVTATGSAQYLLDIQRGMQ